MSPRPLILAAVLLCFLPAVVHSENATTSTDPDIQRFQSEKLRRLNSATTMYVMSTKAKLQKAWQPPEHTLLMLTKVRISLDATGSVTEQKILTPSKSDAQDKSVTAVIGSVHFSPLPMALKKFDLFLSFMSDGTTSMVDLSQTPEATAYYSNVLNLPHPSPSPRPVAMPMPSLMPSPSPNPSPSMAMGRGAASLAPMPRAGAGSGHVSSVGPVPVPISTAGSGPAGGGPSPSPITNGGAPHIGPSLDAQKDVDYRPYMADLIRRIKRAWTPPKGEEDKVVVVRFKIGRGGELSDLRIEKTSGSSTADQAARKAVEKSAPFRQLPAGSKESVEARINFDRNHVGSAGTFKSF